MQKIIAFIGGLFLAAATWMGAVPQQSPALGGAGVVPQVAAYFQTVLSASISSSATTMTLASASTTNGASLPSGYYGFTLDAQNSQLREIVEGYLSGTTVSNMVRGISPINPDTTSTAYEFPHNIGASVTITDYSFLGHVQNLLTGSDTFPGVLQYATSVTNSIIGASGQNLVNQAYVASTSYAGTVNGSLTTKGIYQESTQAQFGTSVGSTGADLIVPTRDFSSVASTSPIGVVASGTLDPSFLLNGNYALGSTTVQSLTSASTTLNGTTTVNGPSIFNSSALGTTNIWGTGASGSSTMVASTTLTSDAYYTNLTITSGTVLNTANYRLFVSGTLTVNTGGIIADNGNAGGAGNTGIQGAAPNSAAGGLGATATATGTLPSNAPGGAGGAGGSGANTSGGCGGGSGGGGGASGGNMGIYAHNIVIQTGGIIEALGGSGGIGGNGVTAGCASASGAGNGGQATTTVTSFADSRGVSGNATSSQAGGAGTQSGGAYTPAGVATTSKVLPYNVVDAIGDIDYSTLSIVMGSAGTSGGPGGGGSANGTGSGGGSGGNGGSGGVIVLVYSSLTNSGTISVAGGSPGAIGTGAGTAATLGATGLTGKIYQLSL